MISSQSSQKCYNKISKNGFTDSFPLKWWLAVSASMADLIYFNSYHLSEFHPIFLNIIYNKKEVTWIFQICFNLYDGKNKYLR